MDILSLLRNSPGAQAWLAQQAPASALAAVGISPREALDREMSYDGSHPRQQEQAARDHFRSYGPQTLADAFIPGYGAGGDAKAASEAYGEGRYGAAALNAGMAAADFLPFLGALPAAAKGIRAFHGSPHDFDRFDMSKIGTGEGAQAYGHGLYFAENEGVAKAYRDNLSRAADNAAITEFRGKSIVDFRKQPLETVEPEQFAIHAHQAFGSIGKTRAEREKNALRILQLQYPDAPQEYRARVADIARAAKPEEFKTVQGRMYEVNINADPEAFLDWDKPLSEQGAAVQGLARSAGVNNQPAQWSFNGYNGGYFRMTENGSVRIGDVSNTGPGTFRARLGKTELGEFSSVENARAAIDKALEARGGADTALQMRGRDLYSRMAGGIDSLVSAPKDRPGATKAMLEAGIPGIRYLDAGSRGAGDGSRNYVVFDDRLITILRKYGIGGLIAGGGAYALTDAEYAQAAELLAQDGMNTGAQ